MSGIYITVTGNIAKVTKKPKRITSGTVGLPVTFSFDEQWDGVTKTAVFRAGGVGKIVSGLEEETVVPWEVLERPGPWLSIGIYGEDDSCGTVISAVPVDVAQIYPGALPVVANKKDEPAHQWICTLIGQSAYELAVQQGYDGTLEEWLVSLRGKQVELQCVEDVIQWRWQGEEEWQALASLSEINATAEKLALRAEMAAERSETAANKLENAFCFEKGEGTDGVVQVITTESGNEELDNKPVATGDAALALGKFCIAEGNSSAAVNYYNRVYSDRAFACGWGNELRGYCAFCAGANNAVTESGKCGSAFGANNTVSGEYATAFGVQNAASGENTLAAGQKVIASGKNAVAVGQETTASGENAVAGGYLSKATANYALALGHTCVASAPASVAVGSRAKATGAYARAVGLDVEASGVHSHAVGNGVKATGRAQTVVGEFNVAKSGARLIVGNGTADDARSNALEVYDNRIVVGDVTLTADAITLLNSLTVSEGVAF